MRTETTRHFFVALTLLAIQMRFGMLVEAQEALLGRWRFGPGDIHEQQVKPLAGSLAATISGPVQFSEEQPRSLLLDGRHASITLSEEISQVSLPRRELTLEAWLLLDSVLEWGGIIGLIQDNGSFEKGWLLGTRKEQFLFGLSTQGADDGDGKITYLTSRSVYEPGQWYHVVATYDGVEQKIYVDGQLKNRARDQSGDINYPPQAVYCIGAYRDRDEHHRHAGQIAEVSVYGRAWNGEEIAARFGARKAEFPGIQAARPEITDWPTYLHDNARTGMTPERIQLPLALRWAHRARHAPRPAWPPPAQQDFWHNRNHLSPRVIYDRAYQVISVNGRVFYGSSADDQVRCLDLATGRQLWSFFTGGPVRLAPQYAEGNLYFGSDDGHVYCLEAETGELRWRFRAAPSDRLIPGNGRLISAWPVRTGVVVQQGVARLAAGLFPSQGVHQFALIAESGKPLARGTLTSSPQGYMQRRGDQLFASNGRAPAEFFAKLRRQGKGTGEYLGQTQKDYPYTIIGAGDVRFVGGDDKLAALGAGDGRILWTAKVEGRVYSLAVAGGCLLASTDRGLIYCFQPSDAAAAHPKSAEPARDLPAGFPYRNTQERRTYEQMAERILRQTGLTTGYCLVTGSERGALACELAQRSQMRVLGLEDNAEKVRESRNALARAGLYGRVSIIHGSLDRLPLGDCLINLVVSERTLVAGTLPGSVREVQRVLRPQGGVALLGQPASITGPHKLTADQLRTWLRAAEPSWKTSSADGLWTSYTRGSLEGAGEWTHQYANPANTACSSDSHVAGPLALQWFGRPGPRLMVDRHHRTVAPLYTRGRLFVPGNNHVFAVDAYNGAPLWDRSVPGSRRIGIVKDCGMMAASAETLYLLAGDQCHRFDAQTGQPGTPFPVPQPTAEKARHWGYLAQVGDLLLGSGTKAGAARSDHAKAAIEEGTYGDFRSFVTSDFLFCLNRNNGQLLWKYQGNRGAVVNPTLTSTDRRVYFVESANPVTLADPKGRSTLAALLDKGAHLVALDALSGQVVWKTTVDYSALQHHLCLCLAQDRLIVVGSRNVDSGKLDDKGRKIEHVWYDIHAVDAATGKPLWMRSQNNQSRSGGDHGEQDKHPVVVGNRVIVEPYAYELVSGKPLEGWKLDREGGGCGTLSASSASLFFRASHPTMCDLITREQSKVNTVSRPGCWINIIPAGGLVLIPEASSGCTCNLPLQTSMAFIPKRLPDSTGAADAP